MHRLGRFILIAFLLAGGPDPAIATVARQASPLISIRGVVTDSAGTPLSNARVTLTPSGRGATTNASGIFLFRGVPAGTYHADVSLLGYAPGHAEVTVPAEGEESFIRIELTPTPLSLEGVIVTGTPGGADPLTVAQSATQISGRAFDRQAGASVAAMLDEEPGISARYSGPAATTPVIRGLTGERVVMLENGQRTGDLSGTAPDHALSVDPLSASRIEVVRGPASLLYGSGAIGGVVNVIGMDIPSNVPTQVEGYVAAQGVSVTPGGAASGQALIPLSDAVALTGRGGFRQMGDVRMGGGEVLDNTSLDNVNGSVGLGYVRGPLTAGAAFNLHRFGYGIPFGHSHEEGESGGEEPDHEEHVGVDLEGYRYEVELRGSWNPPGSTFRDVNVAAGGQWYEHDEIEGDGTIGTTFRLRTQTIDVRTDTDLGRARGTIGISGLLKQYEPTGEEALTPFARSANLGIFVYQETPLVPGEHESEFVPHLQLGGRLDQYDITTDASENFGRPRERTFRAFSGSVGVNFPLPQGISLGGSVSRAYRAPSVEELFSNALHAATGSFDVGNPDLNPEVSLGLEAILRAQTRTVTTLASAYYNHIDDYIAPEISGDTTLMDAEGSFVVPLNRFAQEDASLLGVEGKVEVLAGRYFVLGARGDRVRGRFAGGEPLPYMPAARLGGDLRWDNGTFSAGTSVLHAFAQGEVPEHELATDAYTLVDLTFGYTRTAGGLVHSLTLRAENLTDELYREATSRIKDLAPNPGRNVSVLYRLLF